MVELGGVHDISPPEVSSSIHIVNFRFGHLWQSMCCFLHPLNSTIQIFPIKMSKFKPFGLTRACFVLKWPKYEHNQGG